jgi:hypothetical protein
MSAVAMTAMACVFNCQTARRYLLTCRHASSPRVSSGHRARRLFLALGACPVRAKSSSCSPKGACGTPGEKPRPRRPHLLDTGSPACISAHGQWFSPSKDRTGPPAKFFAGVPHATVLSACYSQRRHALGALTECLVSPHCWVLGPPTPTAGHRPFTTLRRRASTGLATARKARSRDGSVASRSAPAMRPARLFVEAGRPINNPRKMVCQPAQEKNLIICFLRNRKKSCSGRAQSVCWSGKSPARHHHSKNPPAAPSPAPRAFCCPYARQP